MITAQQVAKWKGTQSISLINPTFEEHGEFPSFPKIQTLLVFVDWQKPLLFPSGFFSYMPTLNVLDLDLLKPLSFPVELRNLKKLRILMLNCMERREAIPSHIISSLSSRNATGGDCRALLEELEVSISLISVLSIQTLWNSHKLQRCLKHIKGGDCSNMNLLHLLFPYLEELELGHCSKSKDVIVNMEKEVQIINLSFSRDRYLYHLSSVKKYGCLKLIKLTCLIYAPYLKF